MMVRRAAEIQGRTISDFVVGAAQEAAQRTISEVELLKLSSNAGDRAPNLRQEGETCLCGHYPIIELCVLGNRLNNKTATVGNCCVKKFIGLPSDRIFQAVKRVRKDATSSMNAEAIDCAFQRGWIACSTVFRAALMSSGCVNS